MAEHPAQVKLAAYLDSQLSAEEARKLEKHLADCVRCRKELEALKSVLALVEIDTPPPTEDIAWNPSPATRFRWWYAWVPAAAAAAGLMIILGINLFSPPESQVQPQWMVVEGDSLSAEEGSELALMLAAEDEELVKGLESYAEISSDVYTQIYELSDEEEAALEALLREKMKDTERS